jgi:hypothetical protein
MIPTQLADIACDMALCQLESGDFAAAKASLKRALEVDPSTPNRSLIAFYWLLLTGEKIDPVAPSDRMPDGPDVFSQEPDAATSTPSTTPAP